VFLKSLSLKGFKSFADATTLEMEQGVTVVVGPNGSGKSNVVDAIAWVLGAQAPSAVRSQKMDDVIFAGTAKRPALGRAEVSLCIDNSAGILPVDFAEITITRTLFRDGDSEYSLNGVPCRLLDIQELLSDSGVGRQQHVIVSQGQIDAVLNARPEDRRAIIEEAAGVLKFRRRREKAQRRLKATEENLTRVQDLMREVRRQLRPLERQAEAARRHGGLLEELTTLRKHLAGREIVALRGALTAARSSRGELGEADRALTGRLRQLDEEIAAAEEALAATGADDISDRLARVEGLRERARGMQALLVERISGLERELGSSVDQGVIETLEAETARLRRELEDVDTTIEGLEPDTARVAAAERQIAEQRSLFEQERTDVPEAPAAAAGELRGRLAALESSLDAARATDAELAVRLEALGESGRRLSRQEIELKAQLDRLAGEMAESEALRQHLVVAVEEATDILRDAEERQHRSEADAQAWQARAEALSLALDDARSQSGVETLAGIEGVLGTLADVIDIDEGWESAFEAAAGPALAAVVVDDVGAALAAVDALRVSGHAGGILAVGSARPLASGSGPLRLHVRSAVPGVDQLLDVLVAHVQVSNDWRSAIDAAMADPRGVYVTRDGDRFAADGWRVGLNGSGATGAALEEALDRSDTGAAAAEGIRGEVAQAEAQVVRASRDLDDADSRIGAMRRENEVARDAHNRVSSDLRAGRVEVDVISGQRAEISRELDDQRDRQRSLAAALPELEADERQALERGRALDATRRQIDRDTAEIGARRTELEVRVGAVEERRQFLRSRLDELDTRLARYAEEREQAGERREQLETRLRLAESLRIVVADKSGLVEAELAELRTRRQAQSESARAAVAQLDRLRGERATAEKDLAGLREQLSRREVELAEANLRLETVVDALRRDLDCEPGVAVDTGCPPLDAITPKARERELERELRIMGPINPLALEEHDALKERHEFLNAQLEDVRSSRRELNRVIRAVDDEIVTVFAAAFADVAANFEQLFTSLFPGGTGKLRLTQPDNLLETGIEIEAKPSGKNVKKLSLLSGGERSLTALGFLFAVFRSRPSPFYVMDEVEAALDDVNLHRFLQLVHEFRDDAQLIIVSHQKRTMEAADCLYGITMQPGGSSKAVSEKAGGVGPAEIDLRTPVPEHQSRPAVL
jgi:chromosome segregation protein